MYLVSFVNMYAFTITYSCGMLWLLFRANERSRLILVFGYRTGTLGT